MYSVKFIKSIINERQSEERKKSLYVLTDIPFLPVNTIAYQFGKIIIDPTCIEQITWDHLHGWFVINVKPTIICRTTQEFNEIVASCILIGWKILNE